MKHLFLTTSRHDQRWASRGQTLIEILIATAVVAVVLTAIAYSLTFTIKNSAEARYRALATSYAQEVVEAFRRERTRYGWDGFYAAITTNAYCFNEVPATLAEFEQEPYVNACGAQEVFGPSGTAISFQRDVTVQKGVDEMTLNIVVRWQDTADWNSVTVTHELKKID